MKALKVVLVLCLAAIAAAQSPPPSGTDTGKYEVLGLKLGSTAQEAESVINARFHVKPDQRSYSIIQGVPRFAPNRPYVSGIFFELGEVRLSLNFAEVVPGEAAGSEILWHVDYTPLLKSEADKQLFVARVVEKYGEPIKVFSRQDYFWADRAHDSQMAFDTANIPFLHLTTYTPLLAMQNSGILRHMTEVFNSKQRSTAPPL